MVKGNKEDSNKKSALLKLLGKTIATQREKEKLTQAQLAEISKLDTTTIWRIENGHLNSKIYNILQILIALRMESLDLTKFKEILEKNGDDIND